MPEVHVVHPIDIPSHQIKRALLDACEKRQWKYTSSPTRRRAVRDSRDILIRTNVLNPQQATQLYAGLHRRHVGVIQLLKTYVPITPNPKGRSRDYLSLSQFVRYKAFYSAIDPRNFSARQAEVAMSAMENWISATDHCTGESDARCLPLYVFSADYTRYAMDTDSGRQQFNTIHGPQGSRVDKSGFRWTRARDMHGGQVLHVAGRPLIKGFHWDVGHATRTRGAKTVSNTVSIWKVLPRGHVNIYPDSFIRKGHDSFAIFRDKKGPR